MKRLKHWQIFRLKERNQEIEEPASNNEYIIDLLAKWADHRFTTHDGRRFAFVQGSDSILNRTETLGLVLTRGERSLLEKGIVVGAIVEFGTIGPPMIYGDFDTLKSDWLGLHQSFKEPLTEEESIAFNVTLTFDEDTDEDTSEETYEDQDESDLLGS